VILDLSSTVHRDTLAIPSGEPGRGGWTAPPPSARAEGAEEHQRAREHVRRLGDERDLRGGQQGLCAGRDPPALAVKRPPRSCKSATPNPVANSRRKGLHGGCTAANICDGKCEGRSTAPRGRARTVGADAVVLAQDLFLAQAPDDDRALLGLRRKGPCYTARTQLLIQLSF
jgi:hypothetical protein